MKLALRLPLAASVLALVSIPALAAPVAGKAPSKTASPETTKQLAPVPATKVKRGRPLIDLGDGVTPYSGELPVPGLNKAASAKSRKMKKIEPPRLDRGEKVVLTPDRPTAEGVGLVAKHAEYYSIGLGAAPVIYFHGGSSGSVRPRVGFMLDASTLGGDDLAVSCRGLFPGTLIVRVTIAKPGWAGVMSQTIPVSSGKAKFFVSPGDEALSSVVVLLESEAPGLYQLEHCKVERDAD